MEFDCEINPNLCFFNSSCVVQASNGIHSCVCSPGFQHDDFMGHFPNCSLPTWFLPTFFAINTAGTLYALVLLLQRLSSLRSTARTLVKLYVCTMCFQWLSTLGIFVQNGFYEAALAMFVPTNVVYPYLATQIMFFVLTPVYAATMKSPLCIKAVVYGGFGTITLIELCVNLAAFAYIRDVNQVALFNLLMSLSFGCIAMELSFIPPFCIWAIHSLEGTLKVVRVASTGLVVQHGQRKEELQDLLIRLGKLKKGILAVWISNAPTLAAAIAFWVLGSLPFMYIFLSVAYTALWSNASLFVKFIQPTSSTSSQNINMAATENKLTTSKVASG